MKTKQEFIDEIKKEIGYDGYPVEHCSHCKKPLYESIQYIDHSSTLAWQVANCLFENKPDLFIKNIHDILYDYFENKYAVGDQEADAGYIYDYLIEVGFIEKEKNNNGQPLC